MHGPTKVCSHAWGLHTQVNTIAHTHSESQYSNTPCMRTRSRACCIVNPKLNSVSHSVYSGAACTHTRPYLQPLPVFYQCYEHFDVTSDTHTCMQPQMNIYTRTVIDKEICWGKHEMRRMSQLLSVLLSLCSLCERNASRSVYLVIDWLLKVTEDSFFSYIFWAPSRHCKVFHNLCNLLKYLSL